MELSEHIVRTYTAILEEELVSAMGCTEPIAIAYAASVARHALGEMPARVEIGLSGNIIKNVKSVIVPAMGGLHGIGAAVVAGLVAVAPDRRLEVLTALGEGDIPTLRAVQDAVPVTVREVESASPFFLDLTAYGAESTVHVVASDGHTNLITVEKDGEDLLSRYHTQEEIRAKQENDRSLLNVADIVTYADTAPLDTLRPLLKRQIENNVAIAEEGLHSDWGASIGKLLYQDGNCTVRDRARAYAAASDARISGCELPVCIISGSGNQGITASLPVYIYAKEMGVDEDTLLRALIVSDLITVYQKTGIGCLSAYCGAISAGCGCGTGICYLHGGRFREIAHTLVNAVAIRSGTICDGAKASCAAKIAMAVEAGIMGFEMFRVGNQFYGGDGIVTKGVENTIRNVGRLARDGMSGTDREIIRMMLETHG